MTILFPTIFLLTLSNIFMTFACKNKIVKEIGTEVTENTDENSLAFEIMPSENVLCVLGDLCG